MGLTKCTFITDTQMKHARYAKETFYIHKLEILDLFQCTAKENIPLARHLYTLSRDKIIDFPYDSTCRETSLGCLRHTLFGSRQVAA